MLINVHPLVTIAIPTYNRANNYLLQALESARKQTYPNIQIIVADNCSVDATEKLITSIADARIQYFKHHINIGANRNFNFCLHEAKGDYFVLLSDDDLIDDDFVETCMKDFNYDVNVAMIRTGVRLIDANGQVLRERPNLVGGFRTDDFFRGWFGGKAALYLCNTLFHTEKLRGIGGFRSKYNLYDDVMAVMQLASKYGRIDIQDIKASARVHVSEMGFTAKISEWCEDSLMLLDLMCESVAENGALIRREGMQILSRRNYSRAGAIKSPLKRFIAYMIVFKKFNYRYPPPLFPQRLR